MKKITRFIIPFFFVALLCDTYAVATHSQALQMLFKPLLMPALMLWYWLSIQTAAQDLRLANAKRLFLGALFFAFCGDVLLLFPAGFVVGLGCFLVTHLCYIRIISRWLKPKSLLEIAQYLAVFLLCFGVLLYFIGPQLNDLLIPVVLYGVVISTFGAVSLVHYLQEKSKTNRALFVGAILFILSDSLIAINQFYFAHTVFEVLLIVLYALAQYLIARVMLDKAQVSRA